MRHSAATSAVRRIMSMLIIVFLLFGQSVFAASADDEKTLKYLQGIMDMIRDKYKGNLTDSQLIEGALSGMLGSLDPYTTYYTPKEAEAFLGTVTGTFAGIGAALEKVGDYVVITKVYPATPAEEAGLVQGDKITEADGKSLIKKTAEEAVAVIRGDAGTVVKLGILHSGSTTVKTVSITRRIIKLNPVTYEVRDGIGYIKLEMFNENTNESITAALMEFDKKKITKVVLDLRGNPGGEVGQAVAVAQKFVPKGLITKLDYKSEAYPDITYNSYLEKPKYKLAVLVNENSASASEIVSGAIQDTGVGKLVGTKTFGKAKFQGIFPLLTPDASEKYEKQLGLQVVNGLDLQMLYNITPAANEIAGYTKMTLGLYYTPKGRMIDGTGLTPDVAVQDPKPVADIDINSIQKLTRTALPKLNDQGVDVYNTEKILKVLGYTIGPLDTTLDAKTVTGLTAYQKKTGLSQNGRLDDATQIALNKDLLNIIYKYDKQYAAAVQQLK